MNEEINTEGMANDFVDIDTKQKKESYKIVVPILYLVITVLVVLLVIEIKKQLTNPELEIFKNYMEQQENYECSKNICKKSEKSENMATDVNEINFNKNVYQYYYISDDKSIPVKITYNWSTGISTYYSSAGLLWLETEVTYNFKTGKIKCDVKDKKSVEDEGFCELGKASIDELKADFDNYIVNSKSKYFDEQVVEK